MPTLVRPVVVPAKPVPLFSADFWSVTVFCGIGLLVSLVAIGAGDKGVGFSVRSDQPAEERLPPAVTGRVATEFVSVEAPSDIGQRFQPQEARVTFETVFEPVLVSLEAGRLAMARRAAFSAACAVAAAARLAA